VIWIALAQDAPSAKEAQVTSPWLVDEFVDRYVWWREESAAARSAYETWTSQDGGDPALAFAVYQAALDREERAARAYQECAARIAGRTC
jgi:hypothetical protein